MALRPESTVEPKVPQERRSALLAGVPAFSALPAEALGALAARLEEQRFHAQQEVVVEGSPGDRLYLIAEGRAEVSTRGPDGAVPLQALGAGEMFGEIALLTPGGIRQATVVALTSLLTLSIGSASFQELVLGHPQVAAALHASAEAMLTAKFLKQASPFTTLDARRLRELAARLERVRLEPGAEVIRQGERGDACYLLRSGRAEVVIRDPSTATERQVAVLDAGALFGEAALLTDSPRNATVRTLEAAEVLVIRRGDLLDSMASDEQFSGRVLEQVGHHDRPCQAAGVSVHQRVTEDGETITTLKDSRRESYYRLSPDGWFIWQRLDGQHTMDDLVGEYEREFKAHMPLAIGEVVAALTRAGFVQSATISPDVASPIPPADPLPQRVGGLVRRIFGRKS